jgi:hypothetical protein
VGLKENKEVIFITTINFINNNIAENTPEFQMIIIEIILNLKPNKFVKFKTTRGIFGVFFRKKNNRFSISLDGCGIDEVTTAKEAIASILSLYEGRNSNNY